MITAMSLTNGTITVIVDNGASILTARNDHPRWAEIQEAYKTENTSRLLTLLSLQAVMEEYSVGYLSVNGTGVTYRGHPLHTIDSQRVLAFLGEGLPYKPIANYIERKLKNPSARAITELYTFLEHKNMPLTPDGFIIAYKGVQSDLYSVMGNVSTVVLQGVTDTGGHILNEIGKTIEIERGSCDDDFRNGCSFGLHAGSLAYAKGWGQRTILVQIDPADVVSVPEDCNCQKLRCCKYTVLGEYTGPLPNTYTSEFSTNNTDSTPEAESESDAEAESESDEDEYCDGCNNSTYDCTCDDACSKCGSTDCSCGWNNQDETDTPCGNAGCDGECKTESALIAPVCDADVVSRLKTIIEQHFWIDNDKIKSDSKVALWLDDSLDCVEFSMAIEDEFGIEIPDHEAENLAKDTNTFGDIVIYVSNKYKTPTAPTTQSPKESETPYLDGMREGVNDRANGSMAKYLAGDQEGADSHEHALFIDGYVCGYA